MKLKCPSPLCFSSESDEDYRASLKQHFDSGPASSASGGGAGGKSISLLKRIGSNLLQNLSHGPSSGSVSLDGPGSEDDCPRQFYHAYDHQYQQHQPKEGGPVELVDPSNSAKYRYRAPVYAPLPYFCKKYEIERKHKIKKRDLVRLQHEEGKSRQG